MMEKHCNIWRRANSHFSLEMTEEMYYFNSDVISDQFSEVKAKTIVPSLIPKRCNRLFMVYDGGVLGKEMRAIVLPLQWGLQTVSIQQRSVGVLLLIL